mmetsp:Transcript_293/g.877  ORF Transcript_293/g.877 Transcript_293/m.877 type:complete len:873 (-) Transcript_293:185-2803(-)
MGCCGSSSAAELSTAYSEPQQVSRGLFKAAHERLRKLQELDAATKVPFVLVELTGEGDGQGEIEICGKDEYGIYEALDGWLKSEWGCTELDVGDETEKTKIPFCKAGYTWPGYLVGDDGLNNMGLMTMRLIDFVSGQLSWTLAVVNGGNVGKLGDVRETQVVFKAPHPMNLVAPHLMVELRSAGFIEVCGDLEEEHAEAMEALDTFFLERFRAEALGGHEAFCDRYYQAGEDVFRRGREDGNFRLLTTQVCDRVVQLPGWSLVCSNSGCYGEEAEHLEQQLVFRRDEHPLGDAAYLLVILSSTGEVEVNGRERRGVYSKLGQWLQSAWGCRRDGQIKEGDIFCRRYAGEPRDTMDASAEVIAFFEMQGWEMQVCSQQVVKHEGKPCREQQLFFRPGKTEVGTIEPHLLLELYAGEGDEALYEDEEATQVLANQRLRAKAIGQPRCQQLAGALAALEDFVLGYLGGACANEAHAYHLNVFLCRGRFENNLAQWTMRLCDFMVDRLGWSFIVCSLCNMGECGQNRAQQLLFRFDGDKRDVPLSTLSLAKADVAEEPGEALPDSWRVLRCEAGEREALQQMLDSTFRRVLTRDRHPDDDAPEGEEMPFRLELVHAFRSEHAVLFRRFQRARAARDGLEEAFSVKTSQPASCLTQRLGLGEAFLFHGTNPSSAMSILRTGFVLDHAGSSTGTMFGAGIYMAECSSKSDEYGHDDGGNTYPSLNAILVCRCYVGRPYVAQQAGEHTVHAREQGFDCVCGDRESKVGTYREFIFFDEAQVYPEFAAIYRRQYLPEMVPENMQTPTTGTTGRYWQMRVDKRWANVPPEVNKLLIQASKDAEPSVDITLHGTAYSFNVVEQTGLNRKTGNTVRLRAPMQS